MVNAIECKLFDGAAVVRIAKFSALVARTKVTDTGWLLVLIGRNFDRSFMDVAAAI